MEDVSAHVSSYLGLSFAVFLGFLPRFWVDNVASLQSRNSLLSLELFKAEEKLHQMRFRQKEDSKANARVVEIFASHRHAWQQQEKRLLHRIDAAADEIATLRLRISEMERSEAKLRCSFERLQGEVVERDGLLDLMSRREAGLRLEEECTGKKDGEESFDVKGNEEDESEENDYSGDYERMGRVRVLKGMEHMAEPCFAEDRLGLDEMAMLYLRDREKGFAPDFSPAAASSMWTHSPNVKWQDVQFDSHKPTSYGKHPLTRREYPWDVSGGAAGVSSRLKLLEQELSNLEEVEKVEVTALPLFLRKIWKRYQSLAARIDDLCRRMRISDTYEPSMSPDFRTKQQTVFLVEASTFQHEANEMRRKLNALHTEMAKGHLGDELTVLAKLAMKRSMDSIRNNFMEIQRNLEVWLARIMGDLEGILARDADSSVRDYYISRHPSVR